MTVKCPDTFKELEPGATTSHTGRELPDDWSESEIHCVAMAGARASGKSLYLAVVIKQLELLADECFDLVNVEPLDASTKNRYEEHYEAPLYEQMKIIKATLPASNPNAYQNDPFIYSIGSWPDGNGGKKKHYLVVRDVAGEDLENSEIDPEELEFFKYADLIIMLFDPLKVDAIALSVEGLIPSTGDIGGKPEELFSNLLRVLGDARPRLAMAVSKFDTLQVLDRLKSTNEWQQIMSNRGAAFCRDDGWFFSPQSSELLHWEVKSLLKKMNADKLLSLINYNYPRDLVRFFAVSALGQAPVGDDVDRKGIAPYRVLDPLLWILTPSGVFTKKV